MLQQNLRREFVYPFLKRAYHWLSSGTRIFGIVIQRLLFDERIIQPILELTGIFGVVEVNH